MDAKQTAAQKQDMLVTHLWDKLHKDVDVPLEVPEVR